MGIKKRVATVCIAILAISINVFFLRSNYIIGGDKAKFSYRLFLCLIVDFAAVFCICNLEELFRIPLDIYKDREMFWDLVRNDFQAKFAGSVFGIFWAYVQPVITMILYWFVFQVGLRAGAVSDYPFVLFLMSGLVPWFYYSEAWNGATTSLLEYSYLVKKVVFNVGILPVLKVISALFVHVFFLAFLMVFCFFYGYSPSIFSLQLLYYISCNIVLALGISYITAACTAFFRDMAQVVGIALTIGIWITPIMWNPEITIESGFQLIFKINPMYYIVDGFRDSMLKKVWFWEKPEWTLYFWIFSIVIYICGVKMFNRLKIHYADVL
jgi:teichoic acid transport system permease protein